MPKVPTWRIERDSSPRPSGRKASTLSMLHHVPAMLHYQTMTRIVLTLVSAFSRHKLLKSLARQRYMMASLATDRRSIDFEGSCTCAPMSLIRLYLDQRSGRIYLEIYN